VGGWGWNPLSDAEHAVSDVNSFLGRDVVGKIPGGTAVANALNVPYTYLISRPITTFENALNEDVYQGKKTGTGNSGPGGLFSAQSWKDAWNNSAHESPGQGLVLAFNNAIHRNSMIDPYNQNARDNFFKDNSVAGVGSGLLDAGTRVLDPVSIVGKAAATKVGEVKNGVVKPGTNIDDVIAHPKTQAFINKIPGMSFSQLYSSPILKASPQRYRAAALLSNAKNVDQATSLLRIGFGDMAEYEKVGQDAHTLTQAKQGLSDATEAANVSGAGVTDPLTAMRIAQVVDNMDLTMKSNLIDLDTEGMRQFSADSGKVVTTMAQHSLQSNIDTLRNAQELFQQMKSRSKQGQVGSAMGDWRARKSIANSNATTLGSVYDPGTVMSVIKNHVTDPMVRIYHTLNDRVYQSLNDPRPTKYVDFTRDDSVNNVRALLNTYPALSAADREGLAARYAGKDQAGRQRAFNDIEKSAISQTAAKYGLTPEHALGIYRESAVRRGAYLQNVKNRAYGSLSDADGNDLGAAHVQGDSGHVVTDAYLDTQIARGAMPYLDGRDLDLALSRMNDAGITAKLHHFGESGNRIVTEMLDKVYGVWKPLVLLTGHRAYNHVGDDALRSLSKLGALATVGNAVEGAGNFLKNRVSRFTPSHWARNVQAEHDTNVGDLKGEFHSLATRFNDQQGKLAAGIHIDPANMVTTDAILDAKKRYQDTRDAGPQFIQPKNRLGQGTIRVPGTNMSVPDLFGGPDAEYMRKILSSDSTFNDLFDSHSKNDFNSMMAASDHDIITPRDGAKVHANAIIRYVNNQLRNDAVAKRMLNGENEHAIRNWMLNTPEGQARSRALHLGEPMDNIEMIHDMISKFLPTNTMKAAAMDGKFGKAHIEQQWPAPTSRPEVSGNLALLAHGGSPATGYLKYVTGKLMKITGTIPDDVLVRHPLANTLYKGNFIDNIKQIQAQRGEHALLTQDDLDLAQKSSLSQARETMKNLIYDTSRFTGAGSTLRFVSPFFNAWHNALTSWTSLIAENPQLIARGVQAKRALWNSPMAVDTSTGQRANSGTDIGHLAFVMHLPSGLAKKLGVGSDNYIPIAASTLISPTYADSVGNPGFGPLATVAANVLVKDHPALMNNYLAQMVTGGRVNQNSLASVIPSGITDLQNLGSVLGVTGSPDDVNSRASLQWTLYQEQYYDFLNGKRTAPPNWNDISKQASWLTIIGSMANRVLPLGYKPRGDHQFLIDQYKAMMAQDPKNAQQNFYDKYGSAGFMFTQSLSQNKTVNGDPGIPATTGAAEAYKRYSALIKQNPELAAVVVGPEGDGSFNDMAYQWEKANGLRTNMSPQDAASMEQQNLGWTQFNKIAANLNYQVQARGLTSINQSGAKDLQAIKTAYVNATGDPTSQYYNPDFYASYGNFNQNAYDTRIQSIQKIAQDPALISNPVRSDIRSLNAYFQVRDQARSYMAGRKTTALNAKANEDVAQWFDYTVAQLIQSDTKFGPLYERYLKHDDLKQP
jgi:hypothetical protein